MNETAAALALQLQTTLFAPQRPVRLGLISNGRSGRNRRRMPWVEKIVADQPRIHHYPTRDDAELTDALLALQEARIDVLAINGGDGTMARVLGRVMNEQLFAPLPPVVLLPGGTTNMNAGDVGLGGNLASAMKRLKHWLDQPRPVARMVRRPLLRLDTGDGRPPVYGLFFGVGAITRGAEYQYRHIGGMRNELGSGLALARTLWGIVRDDRRFAQPVAMGLRYAGESVAREREVLLLIGSGLERHFAGLQPFWGTGTGALRTTLLEASPRRLLRNLPAVLRGRPNRWITPESGYESRNVDSLWFEMDGTVSLDGELFPVSRAAGPCVLDNGGDVRFLQL